MAEMKSNEASATKRPSMVDVAREAGVAHVTVSRVLNDHPSVKPETRQRVLAAIDELGYQRNDMARALKRGRSSSLGLVLAGSQLYGLPEILLGVEQAATAAGYWVQMSSAQGSSAPKFTEAVNRLTGAATEGVAMIADRPVAIEALETMTVRVPMSVIMSGPLGNPAIASVELDQFLGSRQATQHLLDLGHLDIVHLSGRPGVYDAEERIKGWRSAMTQAGINDPRILPGDFSAESGYQLAQQLIAANQVPTAIFASNDRMAMGALAAFSQAGIRVPQDVSLIGFDDMEGVDFLVPALTTVRQDHVTLGARAIETLVDIIGGGTPRHHLIDPALVVRASTAPPRQ